LISPEGNILGVCTFIISRTGTSNGIGFAIPANMLKPLVKAAQAGSKEVVRPWLGLEVQPITTDMAKSLGLAQTGGVMITRVQKVSPAAKADLQVGDAILKVDGQPLQDEGALMAKVHASSIDGTLTLEVLTKKGDRRDVKLTLSPPPAIGKGDQYLVTVEGPLKGATLADLSPGAVAKFMLTRGTGVVILDLSPDSSAHAFGLKPGDVIESINGKPVRNLNQAKRFLRNPARSWQLALKRGSQSISLAFSH
jgi:serine protease Do